MTLILHFSRILENVKVTFHNCEISLACHLLAAGWMPGAPKSPKIAFHMSLMDVAYHAVFGQSLTVTGLSEILAMVHLQICGTLVSPRRDQLNEAVHTFKILYERREHLAATGLIRPQNPFCAACLNGAHMLSYDVCFGLKRLNTRSCRHKTLLQNGIVKDQVKVDAYVEQDGHSAPVHKAGVGVNLFSFFFCFRFHTDSLFRI